MDLRFAATIAGCMLLGAGAAAYHRAHSRPAAPAPLAAVPPLFMQAATVAPTSTTWPPNRPVAFYQEMLALSAAVATAAQPATTPPTVRADAPQIPQAPQPPQPPQGAGGPPPRGDDTVEIVIRDRFGRPIGVRRVDRRLLAGGRGYPPPRPQYGAHPYRPYGPYAPYGPYEPYGPYPR
jgi:hypothetical protein